MVARKTALITGATAGIGAAFARRLAAQQYDLVLVARDADRLTALASDLASAAGVRVAILPADLSTEGGCDQVAGRLAEAGPIEMLVNNAGIGLNTSILRSSVTDEERMLRLNVHAVLRLTMAALPGMIQRGRGDIVNVSSVAGFGAVKAGSTYAASKAWVTNFSESTAQSVRRFGVRVMALCPGYTRTEFHQRAGIDMTAAPGWLWLDADAVVTAGLRDLRRGRLISVPDWKYKVAVFGLRHLPGPLLRRVTSGADGRIRRDPERAATEAAPPAATSQSVSTDESAN